MHARQLLLDGWFEPDSWPVLECPLCHLGILDVEKKIDDGKSVPKIRYNHTETFHPWTDPLEITGTFSTVLACNRKQCRLEVFAIGDMAMEPFQHIDSDGDLVTREGEVLRVRSFHSPIELFDHHDVIPTSVNDELRRVDTLVWSDRAAAMTAMRKAVEELLTDRKIDTEATSKSGSTYRLSLDSRLKLFRDKENEDLADLLMATKWMGNVATHEDEVTAAELVEAAERVELVLTALYDPTNHAGALARAKAINAAKGRPPV